MNDKQRKAAIIVASILGCGALFYLGGLLGQAFTNYTIWMESGGMCRMLSECIQLERRQSDPPDRSRRSRYCDLCEGSREVLPKPV